MKKVIVVFYCAILVGQCLLGHAQETNTSNLPSAMKEQDYELTSINHKPNLYNNTTIKEIATKKLEEKKAKAYALRQKKLDESQDKDVGQFKLKF